MQDPHKDFFETAYRTGSDIWTLIPYQNVALSMLPKFPPNAMVLDIGSGRGLWVVKLARLGFRVIGIEYVESIVAKANADIKLEGIEKQARFMHGDVRDIPFTDKGFELVTDIGTLQHLPETDWATYAREITRVMKPGGYFLNVTLSRETTSFLGLNPKVDSQKSFEKFGVTYHFSDREDVTRIFQKMLVPVKQEVRFFDTKTDPHDSVALLFSLLHKPA